MSQNEIPDHPVMQKSFAVRVLWLSIVIGALLTLGSVFVAAGHYASGVAAGALIGSLNFWLWIVLVRRMLDDSGQSAALALRFLAKFGLVAIVIGVAIFILKVNILGFAVGISNFVLAIPIGLAFKKEDEG